MLGVPVSRRLRLHPLHLSPDNTGGGKLFIEETEYAYTMGC